MDEDEEARLQAVAERKAAMRARAEAKAKAKADAEQESSRPRALSRGGAANRRRSVTTVSEVMVPESSFPVKDVRRDLTENTRVWCGTRQRQGTVKPNSDDVGDDWVTVGWDNHNTVIVSKADATNLFLLTEQPRYPKLELADMALGTRIWHADLGIHKVCHGARANPCRAIKGALGTVLVCSLGRQVEGASSTWCRTTTLPNHATPSGELKS